MQKSVIERGKRERKSIKTKIGSFKTSRTNKKKTSARLTKKKKKREKIQMVKFRKARGNVTNPAETGLSESIMAASVSQASSVGDTRTFPRRVKTQKLT